MEPVDWRKSRLVLLEFSRSYLFRPAEAARRVALVLTIALGVDVCGSSWRRAARGANVWKLRMGRVLQRSAMHQQG
jgi:hypothetical protein